MVSVSLYKKMNEGYDRNIPPRERDFYPERTLLPEEVFRTGLCKPNTRNIKMTSASLVNMAWKIETQSTCSPTVLRIHREMLIFWSLW
jgi:hypothetical protein